MGTENVLIAELNEVEDQLQQAKLRNELLAAALYSAIQALNAIAEANVYKDEVIYALVDEGRKEANAALKECAQ